MPALRVGALLVVAGVAAGCDKAQLLAPTNSTITVSAPARVLPTGGSTEITAFVIEQAGTPVQNGTTVRFSTSLGSIEPAEVQTRNGLAVTTFFAGSMSGVAEILAMSGPADGGAGDTPSNVLQITVGAAAASHLVVSAAPASLPPSGGTSQITATVLDGSGNPIPGVLVVFSTDAGTLSALSSTSDGNGRAVVSLTTTRQAVVTARAGSGADDRVAEVTVGVATPADIELLISPNPTAGHPMTLTIVLDVAPGNSAPRVVVNWGDGHEDDLGTIATVRDVAHTYANQGSYTIAVRATADGETTTASTGVAVGAPASVGITTTTTSTPFTNAFEFTVTPAASAVPQNVRVDFGDGNDVNLGAIGMPTAVTHQYNSPGQYTVRATQTNADGTTSTAVVVVTATP